MTTITGTYGDAVLINGLTKWAQTTLEQHYVIYSAPAATTTDQIKAGTKLGQLSAESISLTIDANGFIVMRDTLFIPATASAAADWLAIESIAVPAYGVLTATPLSTSDTPGFITVPTTQAVTGQNFRIPPFELYFSPHQTS